MQVVDPALQLYAVIIQSFSVNPDSPVLHIIKCIYRWHFDLIIEGKHLLFFQMFHQKITYKIWDQRLICK